MSETLTFTSLEDLFAETIGNESETNFFAASVLTNFFSTYFSQFDFDRASFSATVDPDLATTTATYDDSVSERATLVIGELESDEAIAFDISFQLSDLANDSETQGSLTIEGDTDENDVTELDLNFESDRDGEVSTGNTNFVGEIKDDNLSSTVTFTEFDDSTSASTIVFRTDADIEDGVATGSRTIEVYQNDDLVGSSTQSYSEQLPPEILGDFVGGNSNLFWRDRISGQNSLWVMDGTTRSESIPLLSVGDTNWDFKATGDFNNDGETDLVWRNDITGKNSIWLMEGETRSESVELNSVGSDWDIKGAGDFNGDGKTDILWRNAQTGQNSAWIMDGTTRSESIPLLSVGDADWDIKGAGDFNGDGETDILWRNAQTGENSVWIMDGTTRSERIALNSVGSDWDTIV